MEATSECKGKRKANAFYAKQEANGFDDLIS